MRRSHPLYPAILAGLALAACGDAATAPSDPPAGFAVVVSNPIKSTGASLAAEASAGRSAMELADDDLTYVSVPTGSVPGATGATIANQRTREVVAVPAADGGFDPAPIPAAAGDTLEITMVLWNGGLAHAKGVVPEHRPPQVVRITPARGKTDVPLNANIVVIFSEPIDGRTLDTSTLRLLRDGAAVAGTVRPTAGSGLGAEFVPETPLEPATTYQLVLGDGITDLSGEALEVPAASAFTTAAASETPLPPGQPATGSLVFTAQPADRTAWLRFEAPAVVVTALTPLGAVDRSFSGPVSLFLVDPFNQASLLDPVGGFERIDRRFATAVNGVATFDLVAIAGDGGTGYRLTASAARLNGAVSEPFDVAPNPTCAGCWDY